MLAPSGPAPTAETAFAEIAEQHGLLTMYPETPGSGREVYRVVSISTLVANAPEWIVGWTHDIAHAVETAERLTETAPAGGKFHAQRGTLIAWATA